MNSTLPPRNLRGNLRGNLRCNLHNSEYDT